MLVSEIFTKVRPTFSFEFFPPKSQQASEELYNTINALEPLEPSYVTITYGAGGTTRELTRELVVRLQRNNKFPVVSHLTAASASKEEIHHILQKYRENKVVNIMALRGDPPRGGGPFVPCENGFCHAAEMVSYIKTNFPDICIGVGTRNLAIAWLKWIISKPKWTREQIISSPNSFLTTAIILISLSAVNWLGLKFP